MTELLPGMAEDADEVVARAAAEHQPVRTVCLFSGGHDSTVLAHRMRDSYDELAHVDTGTALPGVREFVEEFAEELGKPLRILDAGDAYRVLVIGGVWRGRLWEPQGFPGPAAHHAAYQRLKQTQIEALVAELKALHGNGRRFARIMLLTGTRRAESARRSRTQTAAYRRVKAQVWANPLIDWTDAQMRSYRLEHALPESDAAALLHRSGECNCGSFAAPGEREELMQLYPTWWNATIAPLEAEAERLGLPGCVWGRRPPRPSVAVAAADEPMCSDCQLRLDA